MVATMELKGALSQSTVAKPGTMVAMSEKRHSPSKLALLTDFVSASGISTESILAGTGLDAATIRNPFLLTSSLQFLTAARNCVRLYSGQDLGLQIGRRLHVTSYGMYGYALLCSESMERMFDTAVRYHPLANGILEINWSAQGGMASWSFPAQGDLPFPEFDAELYRFLLDLQFAVHITIIKDVMGAWCVPARVSYTISEPEHVSLLAEAFECPIEFDQHRNLLSYPAAWLARTPQLANPITATQLSTHCAKLLDEFRWQAGLTRRVYQELTRTPGRFPEIEEIAETLCTTSRTLRRRLAAEGTSYSDLLANVRKALAIDYLTTTLLATEDIASALGFSDCVAFRHAFKRWTGSTPGEYRRTRFAQGCAHSVDAARI